jgi:probable rRNA maturation factor
MVLNRQSAVRVSIEELNRFLARAGRTLRVRSGAVTICLVTNTQMARWNRAYRGKKGPTDVLSFEIQGSRGSRGRNLRQSRRPRIKRISARVDGFSSTSFTSSTSSASYLGDIAIAPLVARENAERFGRTLEDELRILILHGILHLMGYDHETDDGEMERRERRLRRALRLEPERK